MRALAVSPGIPHSARLDEVAELSLSDARHQGTERTSSVAVARALSDCLPRCWAPSVKLEVHVLDRNVSDPKAALVRDLGGTYHSGGVASLEALRCDVLMECPGAPPMIGAVLGATAAAGITCLVGVTEPGHELKLDIGRLNGTLVLDNDVVFGSVNANRTHYRMAADALARSNPAWLDRLITRRVNVADWPQGLERKPHDIKIVVDFNH